MRLIWQLGAVAAVAFIGGQSLAAVQDNALLELVLGTLTAVLSVLVYRWVVRRTEHREVTELAGEGARPAAGRGALLGMGLFGVIILNLALLGDYDVHGVGSVSGAVGLVGFMAAAAVTEELMFRGVLLRIVESRFGTWIALSLTGVLFGLMHLFNPDATLWGAIAIAIEAGGMLGAAYVATRSLWLPIGLHFGWNFAESGIFSTEVSGNDTKQGLLDATVSGSKLLTGGEFGPEGSLYAVLFGLLTTILFMRLARRRGHLVPRRRKAGEVDATATVSR
jgi:membrane protease YdiL (CAAX protease family)